MAIEESDATLPHIHEANRSWSSAFRLAVYCGDLTRALPDQAGDGPEAGRAYKLENMRETGTIRCLPETRFVFAA